MRTHFTVQVFDSAMMRYQAALTSEGQWFKPTWRNIAKWTLIQILPFYLVCKWQYDARVRFLLNEALKLYATVASNATHFFKCVKNCTII